MSALQERTNSEHIFKDPSKKLGVKYLDDVQLTNSFPDWRALLQRIEEQRGIAKYAPADCSAAAEERFPQMYDNLYAILGGRGTGKSSVVLTLQNKLKEPKNQNIILPIITPEVIIERECSILGWIMSATESVVAKLEDRLRSLESSQIHHTDSCAHYLDSFFENCQFRKDNDLRKSYQELFKRSVQSGGFDTSAYSAEDAIGYRVEQSRRQYKLIQDLNHFWRQLTDVWHTANCLSSGQEVYSDPPMIILIFDDIDLVPERSMELLNTTFQYLTNPNIVIILTAAEKVLQDVIHLKILGRMAGAESPSLLLEALPDEVKKNRHDAAADAAQFGSLERMAKEFYDKVIPPSSRYRLRRYDTIQDKRFYCYSSMKQSFTAPGKGEISSIPIEQFLIGQIDLLKESFAQKGGSSANFLLGGPKGENFRQAYLAIFGNKSRNIANGCLEIMNTVARLCRWSREIGDRTMLTEHDMGEILQALRHLLQALLHSKQELTEFADVGNDFLVIDAEQSRIIVNYELALEYYQKERKGIREQLVDHSAQHGSGHPSRGEHRAVAAAQKKAAALLTLLFFIEGFLFTIDSSRQHLHGYHILSQLLNEDIFKNPKPMEQLHLFPRHQKVEAFLDNCPLVLEHIDQYVDVQKYDLRFVQLYLEDIFRARAENKKGESLRYILSDSIQQEREWVKTVVTMLTIRYSGITIVDSSFLQTSGNLWDKVPLFDFTSGLIQSRKKAAQKFLSDSNLYNAAREKVQQWNTQIRDTANHSVWAEWAGRLIRVFSADDLTELTTLQQYNDRYQDFVSEHQSSKSYYEWAYIAERWEKFLKDSDLPNSQDPIPVSYNLVYFVDRIFEELMDIILNKTSVFLSKQDFSDIADRLLRIEITSEQERLLRVNLMTSLSLARSALPISAEVGQISLEDLDDEMIWQVPAAPLIEYLGVVKAAVERQEAEEFANPYAMYDRLDFSEYFELISYLAIALPRRDAKSKDKSAIRLGGFCFPLEGCIIMDLKMLDQLFDFYFAAKMNIAIRDQDLPVSAFHERKDTLNDKLQELFRCLTADEQSTNALKRLVQEAQSELSDSYYEYLEDAQ